MKKWDKGPDWKVCKLRKLEENFQQFCAVISKLFAHALYYAQKTLYIACYNARLRLTYFLVWVRATGPHQYPIPCKIDVVLVEVGFHILLSSFFLGYEANFYFVRNGEIKRNAVAHHITIPTKENCVPFSWKATNYKVAGYFYYLLFIVC